MSIVSSYNYFCVLPIFQQVLGGTVILSNVWGLIKDIFNACISVKSLNQINRELDQRILDFERRINIYKYVKENNKSHLEKATHAWINILDRYKLANVLDPFIEKLKEQQRTLPRLTMKERQTLPKFLDEGKYGEFKTIYFEVQLQIKNCNTLLKKSVNIMWIEKTEPFRDRLQNIAFGVITALPVVGSAYHLRLIFSSNWS